MYLIQKISNLLGFILEMVKLVCNQKPVEIMYFCTLFSDDFKTECSKICKSYEYNFW